MSKKKPTLAFVHAGAFEGLSHSTLELLAVYTKMGFEVTPVRFNDYVRGRDTSYEVYLDEWGDK